MNVYMNNKKVVKTDPFLPDDDSQPIERWVRAMCLLPDAATDELRMAYREHWPIQGELIFSGDCEFLCQHCIYPPSFTRFNPGMSVNEWGCILQDLWQGLGIRTYVYSGRSVSTEGLAVLTNLRKGHPDAQIGLIDNGISLLAHRDQLEHLVLDWIDISLDGQEREHDIQRGRKGSFQAGLKGALWLVRNAVAPKVNILTCLTSVNWKSVIPMICELNGMGFKNFFISPVTLVDNLRPSPELRLIPEDFVSFIDELRLVREQLSDAWVEVNLFSATYAENVARLRPEIWSGFVKDRDGLLWSEGVPEAMASGVTTELYIRYLPSSLTGTRDFIINANGAVIVPKAVATGRIAEEHVIGNLLHQKARNIIKDFPNSAQFDFYVQEFLHEQNMLGRYVQ